MEENGKEESVNRTQRAKIRAMREQLDTDRVFKNDALYTRVQCRGSLWGGADSRFEREKEGYRSTQLSLRRLKKYNGPTGAMSESNFKEFMGA